MAVSVLVVEDYEAWRRHITVTLSKHSRFQVDGEVADGLEAVQWAERLRPDLIIMDVGLPTINGLEAARRIFTANPETKIVFLSEHRSADSVEAAMRTGASGYVLKSHAFHDLLPAIDAALEGRLFISSELTNRFPKEKTASVSALDASVSKS